MADHDQLVRAVCRQATTANAEVLLALAEALALESPSERSLVLATTGPRDRGGSWLVEWRYTRAVRRGPHRVTVTVYLTGEVDDAGYDLDATAEVTIDGTAYRQADQHSLLRVPLTPWEEHDANTTLAGLVMERQQQVRPRLLAVAGGAS